MPAPAPRDASFEMILEGITKQIESISIAVTSLRAWHEKESQLLHVSRGEPFHDHNDQVSSSAASTSTGFSNIKDDDRGMPIGQLGKVNAPAIPAAELCPRFSRAVTRGLSHADVVLRDIWVDGEDEPSRCVSNVVCVQSLFGYTLSVTGIRASTLSADRTAQADGGSVCAERLITKPSSSVRVFWEMVGACLILFDMVTVPMQVFTLPPNYFFDVMEWLAPIYWNMDLLWSFFLGFYRPDGILELRPKVVATHYLKTWFLYDTLVIVIDWFLILSEGSGVGSLKISRMGRMVRVLRFLRFLRLMKIGKLMKNLAQRIQSNSFLIMIGMMKAILMILILNHMIACGWYFVGIYYDRSRYTWISKTKIEGRSLGYRYTTALHWALVQMGVGSMEVIPTNTAERIYAVVVAIICLIAFSSLVSSVTTGMVQLQDLQRSRHEKEESLRDFMRKHNISVPLRSKIWSYLQESRNAEHSALTEDHVELIHTLPKRVIRALRAEVYTPRLSAHPFFEACALQDSASLPHRALRHLVGEGSRALAEINLGVEKDLFRVGESAGYMYFVTRGELIYHSEMYAMHAGLVAKEGTWLCEQALWLVWAHVGQAAAKRPVELVSLSAEVFEHVMVEESPHESRQYAKLFAEYAANNRATLSDLFVDMSSLKAITGMAFRQEQVSVTSSGASAVGAGVQAESHDLGTQIDV